MNTLKLSLQITSVWLLALGTAQADELATKTISRAELLPSSIIAYAEAQDIGGAIELIRNHPLKDRILAIPAYEAAMQSGGLQKLQMGIGGFETTMGMPWNDALAKLSDGGVSVGLDKSGAVALLVTSTDEQLMEKFRNLLLAFLPKKDGAITARRVDYRGVTAYELKGMLLAQLGGMLMLTNKPEMGKAIVDQYNDRKVASLATLPNFQKAQRAIASKSVEGETRLVSAYVDLDAIRSNGIAKNVFKERIDNVVGEIVLGGVLTNLRHSPHVTAALDLSETDVSLRLHSPHDRQWESPREYQFGEGKLADAPPLVKLDNRLFALSTYRDMSQMWLRSGDFLTENSVDKLAKADAQLGVFFSGQDFGEDILGSFDSGIQIVGRVQEFGDRRPQPAIKVPEVALVFRMKDAEKTQPEMRRTFQSFIGFLNVTGAMNGNPQLDLGMEKVSSPSGEAQLITSSFVADEDDRDSMAAPIQFNFSPTLAFAGDRIVFSSSMPLAKDLIADDGTGSDSESNTTLVLDGNALQQILSENRKQFVASNMLSKGRSQQEAEREIGLLLELAGFLKAATVDLDFQESEMTFSVKVQVQ